MDGRLRNTPEFDGVERFDKAEFGLVPIQVDAWEPFAFVNRLPGGPSLAKTLIRPVRADDAAGRIYTALRGDDRDKAFYYWIFPNVMFNIYLDMLQINVIIPLSYDCTLTIFQRSSWGGKT
jgi:hypothetical protein